MRDLDIKSIKEFDKSDMLGLLLSFSRQYQQAYSQAESFDLPEEYSQVENIVASGMGGSAIGGDLLRSLFSDACPIPIIVNRNYSIPEFVNENTLFIAVSYSGNTEETLAALREASKKEAKIVSISSGGELENYSKSAGIPHFSIPLKGIQPRCAFGYIFVPMMVFLSKLGFIAEQTLEMEEAVDLISDTAKKLNPGIPASGNQAKRIAQDIYSKLPVIYAPQEYDVVAMRWKGQINENSKMMAFYNTIPEMNHNEIVGWGVPEEINRQCIVIMLRDKGKSHKIKKRMDITQDLISAEGPRVIPVESQGSSPLAKSLYFIYVGDFVSYYLAILNGVDPTPIDRISLFKSRLAED